MVAVKICGLTTEDGVDAAVEHGAEFLGLVFYPRSPRFVSPERAAELMDLIPEDVTKVGLFVDADDAWLDRVLTEVRLDLLQFHGAETPERLAAIGLEYGVPAMKAIGVATPADLALADAYAEAADWLLFDAKPPAGADRPGGNAVAFDWAMLAGRGFPLPWMLAGGLTPENVAEAVRQSGATVVDVSSGVEDAPGIKSPDKIRAFMTALGR